MWKYLWNMWSSAFTSTITPRQISQKNTVVYAEISAMTTEEKFNAAVNVIRGLPKNGELICILLFIILCTYRRTYTFFSTVVSFDRLLK